MKRWFIARQGFYEEPENEGGSLVPKVLAYPDTILLRQWTKPGLNWGFGRIATNSITQFDGDNDIYVLPDAVMDMSVGSIPASVRTTMRTRLESAGFVFSAVKTTWTVRQLLEYIGAQVQPGIEVEAQDGVDLWG